MLATYEFVNILDAWPGGGCSSHPRGDRFPMMEARSAASRLTLSGRYVVCLGKNVRDALRLGGEFFEVTARSDFVHVTIPHPSSVSHWWNDPVNKVRAERFLRSLRVGRNIDRTIDKTYLSLDKAEERMLIHRDYIAHCFRWSHVVRHFFRVNKDASARVVDVGCGKEFPLAKALYVNKISPACYIGIDANKLDPPGMFKDKAWFHSMPSTDACEIPAVSISDSMGGKATVISCFEVLEHITPKHVARMLRWFRDVLDPDQGVAFVSTPCYNGSAAGNHINEMTVDGLGYAIEEAGLRIVGRWGTFASIADYKHLLEGVGVSQKAFEELREYYDTNVLSTVFAPLFPNNSRNCLWELVVRKSGDERQFTTMPNEAPWSQHKDWKELAG